MPAKLAICVVIVLGLLLGVIPAVTSGAEPAAETGAASLPAASAAPVLPGRYELVPRAGELESAAEDARAQIARMRGDGAITGMLAVARDRRASIREQLAGLEHETYLRGDRLAQIREQAALQRREVEREDEGLRARLMALDELREAWIARRTFWERWQRALGDEGDPRAAGLKELTRALRTIGAVLDEVGLVFAELLDHQRALADLRRDLLSLEIHADDLIREGHHGRWGRDAPALLSGAFVDRLAAVSFAEVREGIAGTPGIEGAFLDRVRWVIVAHLALALALVTFLRRVRRHLADLEGGAGLLGGPTRTGIFVATAMISFLYQPMPGLWEAAILAILAGAGASLAPQLLPRGERGLVYLLAAIYPPLFLLGVVAFPAPLLRLLLAALCLVGAPLLLRAARRQPTTGRRARAYALALYLGAADLVIALVAQIVGFELLARWLVESMVATAFVIYVVVALMDLASGVAAALSRVEARADASFLERAGARFSSQLRWVFRGLMIAGAILYAGSIWGLVDSADEIWARVADLELRGGELRVRVGSLVVAGVTVYLGYVLSWALRTLLDIHVFERRRVEAGVRASIKAILHYSVVVIAVFAALAALGVSLQSFALIVGALGVGIGFGLQNIVNNFVSGLILLFERPVRVGDTVVIAGEWGVVRKIGLRSTIVRSFDHSEMIVPNSDLVSEKVTNWTLSDRSARVIVEVGVAYGSDVARVIEVLTRVGDSHPATLAEPRLVVLFVGFGESSLDFELRIWIANGDDRLGVRSELLAGIEAALTAEGVVIPFPQRDLHLRTVDGEAATALARPPG